MVKKLYTNIVLAIIVAGSFSSSFAQNTGSTAAGFLEIAVGAQAMGMGGAFVSVANDASSLYWNAAGIANSEKYQAVISHTNWLADISYDFAGLIIPLSDFGTIGLSFTSLSMDDMMVRTVEKPEGTGEYFSAGDLAIGVTYSRQLTDRFSVGLTAKYIQETIWHMAASAFAIDIGTMFKTDLFGGMSIGASMSNFGTTMQLNGIDTRYYISVDETKTGSNDQIASSLETDSWDLPLIFQIGVSTYVLNSDNYKILMAIDAVHPNNDYESVNIGAEFSFLDFIALRGGYQNLFLIDSEGGLSLGVGVNSKMLFSDYYVNFDYAYRDYGRLKNVHYFSVGVKF